MSINENDHDEKKETDFYQEAYSRNIGILSPEEQHMLKKAKVALAGMGGVGGNYLLSLSRLGIGNFSIADFDSFEIANINRQAGATMHTSGKQKCEVMAEMARAINPFLKIAIFKEGINKDNIDLFLEGARVVVDGLDFFCIKDRLLLFQEARKKGIFAITSAPIGFGASLLVFDPSGMTFEEYFNIDKAMDYSEMMVRFSLGISPFLIHSSYFRPESIDFHDQKAPSVGIGPLLCATMVGSEIVKIILDKTIQTVPFVSQFDPFVKKYRSRYIRWGNRGMMQRLKIWYVKKFLLKQQ